MFAARAPLPALRPFVSLVWMARGATSPGKQEWVLPSATAQLLINVAADELTFHREKDGPEALPGAAFSGPFSRPVLVNTQEQADVCGASFHAGGLAPFVALPVSELHNEMVGLRDALPELIRAPSAAQLQAPLDQVRQARSVDARLSAVEQLLVSLLHTRLTPNPHTGKLVQWATTALEHPAQRIGDLVSRSGWSKRRLNEQFKTAVGMPPKRYQRVRRFRQVLAQIETNERLTEVTYQGGFFDQAHFIHEFAEFAGMTPTAYRAARAGYTGHVGYEP